MLAARELEHQWDAEREVGHEAQDKGQAGVAADAAPVAAAVVGNAEHNDLEADFESVGEVDHPVVARISSCGR